jgi:hypothetical protein
VLLVTNRLLGDSEHATENALVKDTDVELTLRGAIFEHVEFGSDGRADHAAAVVLAPGALQRVERIDLVHAESGGGLFDKAIDWNVAHQPMGRENAESGRVHVDERHGHAVRAGDAGIFVAKRDGGLIAMVAVGNQQLLIAHERLDLLAARDAPHAMDYAVLVGDLGERRFGSGGVEQSVDGARRIGIKHEDLFKLGPRVARSCMRSTLGPESVFSWR